MRLPQRASQLHPWAIFMLTIMLTAIPVVSADTEVDATMSSTDATSCPDTPSANPTEPNTDRYCISNGYFLVAGSGGIVDTLRFDPEGAGSYGPNLILSMGVQGAKPGPVQWRVGEGTLAIPNIEITSELYMQGLSGNMQVDLPARLEEGRTLGQSFVAHQPFNRVGGSFPTWTSSSSGFTLTLRREGPRGPVVVSNTYRNITDNAWIILEVDSQPPGTYYLEISNPVGPVGWWTATQNPYADGSAYVDGEPVPGHDRSLLFDFRTEITRVGTLDIRLSGNQLTMRFLQPLRQLGTQIDYLELVTPWEKSGYDVTDPLKTPFISFQNTEGRYLPIEQFKRNDSWELGAPPIYATGQNGYDLEFGGLFDGIDWSMEADRMIYRFRPSSIGSSRVVLTVLPHTAPIPDYFPVFYSSDPDFDALLNRFYYERAYSYPGGSLADWYEWTGLIHSWVNHPHRTLFRRALLDAIQDPDGYVWTFGPNRGWPFPESALYDTRHFTTSAMLILGTYRYLTWTGDVNFLSSMMPKVRMAMRYQLEELRGRDGLLILPGPDHHGRNGDLGSNYWDILPFGHLSAYENIYFYASLQAMAELERVSGDNGAAEEYLQLSEKTRRLYNATFWDDEAGRYIGTIDVDGLAHDYGFTFLNTEAMTYGLASEEQAHRIYHWMENEPTSSGEQTPSPAGSLPPGRPRFTIPRGLMAGGSPAGGDPSSAIRFKTGERASTRPSTTLWHGSS